MQYTISAVSQNTRDYSTKFGDMRSYKVKFEGNDTPVEISQKVTTKPPQVGDVLTGTIDMSSQYGPKFKKEFSQGGNFGQSSTSSGSTSAAVTSPPTGGRSYGNDPFTMYLSYAKDLAVALIASKAGYDKAKFDEVLKDVAEGGHTLYQARPGGEGVQTQATGADKLPDDDFDDSKPVDMSEVDKLLGTSEDDVIDVSEVPF